VILPLSRGGGDAGLALLPRPEGTASAVALESKAMPRASLPIENVALTAFVVPSITVISS